MLNNPTLETLRALKLYGMAAAFEEQLQNPSTASLSSSTRSPSGYAIARQAIAAVAVRRHARNLGAVARIASTQCPPCGRAVCARYALTEGSITGLYIS